MHEWAAGNGYSRVALPPGWVLPMLRMRKLDLYIARNFLVTFFFMLLLITIIIVVFDVAEKIDDFTEKQLALDLIITDYYASLLPFLLNRLAPVCVFLTVVFFTAQLSQRTEIVAMLASGISFYRILLPYLVVSMLLAGGFYYLNASLVPRATQQQAEFKAKYLDRKAELEIRDIHKKIDRGTLAYASTFNKYQRMAYLVTLEQYNDSNRLVSRMDAQSMQWIDSTKSWRLNSVRERFMLPQGESLKYREQLDTTLLLKPDDIIQRDNQAQNLTSRELDQYIKLERERGSDFLQTLYRVRQERIAYALAAIILTFMGVALSSKKRRGGISLQIGLGLGLCFAYILVLNMAPLVLGDIVPVWVAIWVPNLLFLGVTAFLIRIAPK